MKYERSPDRIYELSFQTIRNESELSRFPSDDAKVLERIIHACGMIDILDDIRHSPSFVRTGVSALISGAPVFCDGTMAAAGIIKRYLPSNNDIKVTLGDVKAHPLSRGPGTTRSAAAVELWEPELEGSIAVFGNSPTALFRLLEMIDSGYSRPALIVAFPVGFVGAVESKQELVDTWRGVEYISLLGRRGGSAMAAATVNALCVLARKEAKQANHGR